MAVRAANQNTRAGRRAEPPCWRRCRWGVPTLEWQVGGPMARDPASGGAERSGGEGAAGPEQRRARRGHGPREQLHEAGVQPATQGAEPAGGRRRPRGGAGELRACPGTGRGRGAGPGRRATLTGEGVPQARGGASRGGVASRGGANQVTGVALNRAGLYCVGGAVLRWAWLSRVGVARPGEPQGAGRPGWAGLARVGRYVGVGMTGWSGRRS